jgi:hypothetical protein
MLGHSALILAARITSPHLSVSSAMSLPKSAGEPDSSHAAHVGEPSLDHGVGKTRVNLPVEALDNTEWRRLPSPRL